MHKISVIPDQLTLLRSHIFSCMARDQQRLRMQAQHIEAAQRSRKQTAELLVQFAAQVEKSLVQSQRRLANLPKSEFAADLPVNVRREEIARLIADNQVVVLCGETGSGKTTQLPKICLELGRGTTGLIGCTQPRRIAARTVAARIAAELKTELGSVVGYKIRFSDKTGADAYIKVMTDGILLAETQGDRFLEAYDTLIIDEAHERSLNIDFLLGYLKQLLPRRPDLKIVITSATIDVQRFSKHFDNAPVIEVSGRTYPVEMRYRPVNDLEDEDASERDREQALLDATDELSMHGGSGDILIFLSGEREIRETAEALRKHHPPHTEILPLFARLSNEEQNRVFHPGNARRIILATNVAETSLTVPGIRYVIDAGYARIKRYSYRNKVELLQVEKISQASAAQRAGRCGRVMSGVCVRLYSEEDFLSRPEYTDPEIRRSNLAGVILRLQDLHLGDVEQFPFIEPPDSRMVNDGYRLLAELGAVDDERALTGIGRQLAKLPIDPTIGRMVLAATSENCLNEMLVIASGLSVQDPRLRPLEAQAAADEKHRRFADDNSDFLSYLKLWDFFEDEVKHKKSNRKLLQQCRENFLSFTHLREWREVYQQLHKLVVEMNYRLNQLPAGYDEIHCALLTGLLGNIGFKEENQQYLGARGIKFTIFPGSTLFKRGPKWVVAAELTETTRLYARSVARIEPEWIEKVAGHVIKRNYFEPHWEKKPAQVTAFERVSLFGLVVNPKRRVHFGPINPIESREIFIRSALAESEFETRAAFFIHNKKLIAEIEELEHKSRRQDVLVDQQRIFDFYAALIPQGIYNGAGFDKWRKDQERQQPQLLFMQRSDLMRHEADAITEQQFPDNIILGGVEFKLGYYFDPGHPADGVTITVPLHLLNQIGAQRMEWLVPGLLRDKITALIKGFPQSLRRAFVPVPDQVRACMDSLKAGDEAFLPALARFLQKRSGTAIPESAWTVAALPPHLRMNYKVVDDAGNYLAMGRDLDALREELGDHAQQSFGQLLSSDLERENIIRWDFGELPEKIELNRNGQTLYGYPALLDKDTSVALKVFDSAEKADEHMQNGLLRLFMLALPQQIKHLEKNIPVSKEMCFHYIALGNCEILKKTLFNAIIGQVFFSRTREISNAQVFESCVTEARGIILSTANAMGKLTAQILAEYHGIVKRLGSTPPVWKHAVTDIRQQLDQLVYPEFIAKTPAEWLQYYPRYLAAIRLRLDKLKNALAKDVQNTHEIAAQWQAYLQARTKLQRQGKQLTVLEQYRWMTEELRVSLFAQELKTALPVSAKRLQKLLQDLQI